ncbi:MAG: DUF2868 domain-containing protein [Azoarcus sp.]|nr:DUF2868 domain-containing protein [Azoarcus sp.]MDD2872143.1 DUF2868 domain-containing protein [Azoarcus sp.]
MNPAAPLSKLEHRWLAELVRRHESRHGRLEDAVELAEARRAPPDLETRICRRAELLSTREGWRDAIVRWHGRARLTLAFACVLALVLGTGTAAAVLGDGSRPVNVVWALGGLLGVHLFSLLLWLFGTLVAGRGRTRGGSALGTVWLRLVSVFDRSPAAAELPLALGGLLARGRLASWGLGAVSHLLWFLALVGAAAGLLGLLAVRRYGFVWETTILPGDAFVSLTTVLGVLPGQLGFPVPDAAQVIASGDAVMAGEVGRRAWSGWLLGCVLVYGVLPRVLLTLLCAQAWRRGVSRLALDLSLPDYARLRPRLLPDSERIGVSDPAPERVQRPGRRGHTAAEAGTAVIVALELGTDLPWPPVGCAALAVDGGRLDSRDQRRAAIARFGAAPPARLLIAIDPRLTPDRGTLGLVAELADYAGETRVWALPVPDGTSGRLGLWQDGLSGLELDEGALMADQDQVLAWLEAAA